MRPARVILRSLAAHAAFASKVSYVIQPLTARTIVARFSSTAAPSAPAAGAPVDEEEEEEEYEEEDDEETDDQALLQYFAELDAAEAAKAVPVKPLPVKVTGISGDLAGNLYRRSLTEDNFPAIINDLQGLNDIVTGASTVISRFFQHNNYSAEECQIVVDLLTSDKYKTYESVGSAEVREIIMGSAENMQSWLEARAAVQDLELEPASVELMQKLASLARLDLLPHVASQALDIYNADSKTVPVTVSSAVPLSEDQKKRLAAVLPKYAGSQSLDVTYEVEPSTLGGLLITIESRSIDLTASTQMMETMQQYK